MTWLQAWSRRDPRERAVAVEALLLLAAARVAIRFLPFARAIAFGAVPLGRRRGPGVETLCWAVRAASRRAPHRAKCFEQGLALQRMARARGFDARLHYGVQGGGEGLSAHVWVTLDGAILIGGETAPLFREVGQWP